jgi:hypothetical protein
MGSPGVPVFGDRARANTMTAGCRAAATPGPARRRAQWRGRRRLSACGRSCESGRTRGGGIAADHPAHRTARSASADLKRLTRSRIPREQLVVIAKALAPVMAGALIHRVARRPLAARR